ncbi:TetR/AcrR family transcriptional regulator [Nocardioides mangrovi]|uniref:TetR/AcrR family transcriptional regulator n=1 Tax=Nocardioides mangrovi TaxID=2874580 RepID=A0ABS7UI11_9ACTN|nr:TetR/AcrR family transcriptional regulator [Nocardioides mangrovi]MBZ5740474.1 TetR/AcrR family transcriptional regulator [Nocardioides mangrovi]
MPRVSDAYRQARRDQITAATLRVIARSGLRGLTMAEIIGESGLSAGSVYSHFATKDELVERVAEHVIGQRADRLLADDQAPRPPLEVVRWWLAGLEEDAMPFGAVLQIWGEAASDPGIREVVQRRVAAIEAAFEVAADRWLEATGGDRGTATDTARAMLLVCQGYIVRAGALGPQDLDATIRAAGLL